MFGQEVKPSCVEVVDLRTMTNLHSCNLSPSKLRASFGPPLYKTKTSCSHSKALPTFLPGQAESRGGCDLSTCNDVTLCYMTHLY